MSSCRSCTGCPTRPSPPPAETHPSRFVCPSNSPGRVRIVPPIPQGPRWKPCCVRRYGFLCNAHARPRRSLRFNYFDLVSQY